MRYRELYDSTVPMLKLAPTETPATLPRNCDSPARTWCRKLVPSWKVGFCASVVEERMGSAVTVRRQRQQGRSYDGSYDDCKRFGPRLSQGNPDSFRETNRGINK